MNENDKTAGPNHQPRPYCDACKKHGVLRKIPGRLVKGGLLLVVAVMLMTSSRGTAADEVRLPVLRVGDQTYQDVKVTTKAKTYIFILHSKGMSSIKVSDLPPDVLEQLGYAPRSVPKTPAVWAKQAVAKADVVQFKKFEAKLTQAWQAAVGPLKFRLPPLKAAFVAELAALLVLVYGFFCHCCGLICRQTGQKPGVLVWVPVVQLVPLLRAASMSAWWLCALFLPVLNLVAYVVWSVRIVQVRGRSMSLLLFLLLPVTNCFAFAYLACSGASAQKSEKPQREMFKLVVA